MCVPHCACIKFTFPHARVRSREISDGINFGGDSGGDTDEAGSSSQIASIRHVLRCVNMLLFLSLYFCMYAYVCMYVHVCCQHVCPVLMLHFY